MKRIIATFICIFTILIYQLGFAEDLLIVRGNGQYPPNEMVINGDLQGVHIDLVREVASLLNVGIEFKSFPWKRAIKMIKAGKADAITYVGKSSERAAFIYFFDGNITSFTENALIVWKGQDKLIKYSGNLEELKPYRIAVLRGYFYGEEFGRADYLTKHEVNKMEQMIELLRARRIAIAIVNVADLMFEFKDDPRLRKIIVLKPSVSKLPNYVGFSKLRKHEQLARKFSEKMTAFKQTEKYQAILEKYGIK